MSARHPTLGQLLAGLGYHEGQYLEPRVGRFLSRNRRKRSFAGIAGRLRRKAQRHERRAGRRFLALCAAAAKAPPGRGEPLPIASRKPWKRGRP